MSALASPAAFAPSLHNGDDAAYRQPLSPAIRVGVMAMVIFFHVGGAWALMQVEPHRLEVGDIASMAVRLVPAERISPPAPEINTPPPEDTPPPTPELESMIQPPLPDLPPPSFPVNAPPPKPKPPQPPKPVPPKPRQVAPAPSAVAPQSQPAVASSTPQTMSIFQVTYLVRPNLVYPARAKRAGHQGTTVVRAYIDASGVPTQVRVEKSSGHDDLDEAAISAMRAARVKSSGQALWVVGPMEFKLQ